MMRSTLLTVAFAAALAGCVSSGPVVSKSSTGNLELNVSAPPDLDVRAARLYVDGVFIGHVSDRLPVLYLKRGRRTLRVEHHAAHPWQQDIHILGDPNHQVLNVILDKR